VSAEDEIRAVGRKIDDLIDVVRGLAEVITEAVGTGGIVDTIDDRLIEIGKQVMR
jgi:hypothetical protein